MLGQKMFTDHKVRLGLSLLISLMMAMRVSMLKKLVVQLVPSMSMMPILFLLWDLRHPLSHTSTLPGVHTMANTGNSEA